MVRVIRFVLREIFWLHPVVGVKFSNLIFVEQVKNILFLVKLVILKVWFKVASSCHDDIVHSTWVSFEVVSDVINTIFVCDPHSVLFIPMFGQLFPCYVTLLLLLTFTIVASFH